MARKIKHKDYINEEIEEHYIESEDDLDNIPDDALEGTIAIMNTSTGLKAFMKKSDGTWNSI